MALTQREVIGKDGTRYGAIKVPSVMDGEAVVAVCNASAKRVLTYASRRSVAIADANDWRRNSKNWAVKLVLVDVPAVCCDCVAVTQILTETGAA